MGLIPNTHIATSFPRNLSTGLPIFPEGTSISAPAGTQQIGVGAGGVPRRETLFDVTVPLALWRLRSSASAQLNLGLFAGLSLEYKVEGETFADGTAEVTVSDDAFEGGVGFGFGLQLSVSFSLDEDRRPIFGAFAQWRSFLSLGFDVTLDIIDIVIRLLRASGASVPLELIQGVTSQLSSGGVYGLFGSNSGTLGSTGTSTINPSAGVSVNILSFIPAAGDLIKGLEAIGGSLSVGPKMSVIFPLTLRIVRMTTNDGDYDFESFDGGVFFFENGPTSGLVPSVDELSFVHSHDINLAIKFDFQAGFSILGVLNINASVTLFQSDNFVPGGGVGPYFTELSNEGATAQAELPEVIWA